MDRDGNYAIRSFLVVSALPRGQAMVTVKHTKLEVSRMVGVGGSLLCTIVLSHDGCWGLNPIILVDRVVQSMHARFTNGSCTLCKT